MKRRLLSAALAIVMLLGMLPISALQVDAATTLSTAPNAKVEYGYTADVTCGTIRYISQITNSGYFNWNYWPASTFGEYSSPGTECGTASISMALSYVGINKTPKQILEANNGVTYFSGWGESSFLTPSIADGMNTYINGDGKYSPLVIHLPNYSAAGHYVILAGKVSSNVYSVVDPASNSVWNITINGTTATYNGKTDYIDRIYQYYNANAVKQQDRPAKPALNYAIDDQAVTFTWNNTANTTHYNLWLSKKNASGEWEDLENIFYAESGLSRTLEGGEYRAQLLSYNSKQWESDGSDWVHTWSDDVFFAIEGDKIITYHTPNGDVMETETARRGAQITLSSQYPWKDGSYFCGWSYTQNNTSFDIRPGESLTVKGDVDLYPVYVTQEQVTSGETVFIYDIEDARLSGYEYEEVLESVQVTKDNSYWTDWSEYTLTEAAPSNRVEVRTATLYRYYYFLCPSCGAHEPFSGTSDCGATIPATAGYVKWFTTPYSQCNHKTFSYTTEKYYTTSLGDGAVWCFSSGNLNATAPGTIDSSGVDLVITTGYSSRTFIEQYDTEDKTVSGYRFTPAGIAVNSTNFPDDVFRSYVSTNIDTNHDGYLSEAECTAVAEINVTALGIGSLEGIACFPQLQRLICAINKLTSLDVSQNMGLTYLDCNDNQLTKLTVNGNVALRYLNCSANCLEELDLSGNPALEQLHCSLNSLTELRLSNNPQLELLQCNRNALTRLDTSANTKLTFLWCNGNAIEALDLRNNANITDLNCQYNRLTALNVTYCPKLDYFNCAENPLTDLNVSNNLLLNRLECFDTDIISIDLRNNENLRNFRCSNSEMETVQFAGNALEFYEDSFAGCVTTVYYPEGDSTWDSVVGQSFGGTLTWMAYDPEEGIPQPVTLASISVSSKPTKTTYEIGESLNTSGMVVQAAFSDGSVKTVTSGYTVSGFDSLTAGTKTVTVAYEGKTATFTVTVREAEPEIPADAPQIVVEKKKATAGDTVTVNISLKNNPGLASMKLKVNYGSVLTLTGVTYNTAMGGQFQQPQKLTSPVTLNWFNGLADSEGDGVFATLTFTVDAQAQGGEIADITVTYMPDDVYDITETNLPFLVVNGNVEVRTHVPGDINGDGSVNNKDVTRLFQYLSDYDVQVNESALDVNGDGSVNNKDLTRLFQYLSDWDVEIY